MFERHNRLDWNIPLAIALVVAVSLLIGLVAAYQGNSLGNLLRTIMPSSLILFVFVPVFLLFLGWIMASPKVGLILMILALPLQSSIFGSYGLIMSWLPVAALSVFAFLSFTTKKSKMNLPSSSPQLLWVIFFGYTLLSLYFRAAFEQNTLLANPLQTEGPTFYKYAFEALLMFILMGVLIKERSQINLMIYCLAGLAIVISAMGLLELVSGYNFNYYIGSYFSRGEGVLLPQAAGYRIKSVFYDPNHLANFLVTALFMCSPLLFSRQDATASTKGLKLVGVFFLAILLVALYFTLSAGNLLGLGAGVVALLLFLSPRGKTNVFLIIALFSLAVLVLALSGVLSWNLIPESIRIKVEALGDVTGGLSALEQGPNAIRARLIHTGLYMFSQNPIFGMGMGSFQAIAPALGFVQVGRPGLMLPYPHNSYVLIMAELGIVGIVLLGLAIASIVAVGVRNIREAKDDRWRYLQIGTLSAIFANLVFLFTYGSLMYDLNLWLAMGLTLAIRHVVKNEENQGTASNQ